MNTANTDKSTYRTFRLEVAPISTEERMMIHRASKILGLRKPSFYHFAILAYAQSVLSTTSTDISSENTGVSSDKGGASFCEEEK